ncbi:type IV toxin-antitoxin system AbiEi family antitoxin domain-containing protein [Chromohalobacter canadensis]|uniref:type IV toxin-antitoxin system AbiEi family antitoxin domain-containing protein n=1 Tax=Chromohalobacter canadensis TaxID=141389 RepID=UPI001FE3695E|nr:type IV toxin-antitoxin system AbiEi family antitoxin domain-containing protein [Chromohalobacter canadensis]
MLEGCRSVRTKRAFLVLARHAGHAWYGRLDPHRLDLGKGKRQLRQGASWTRNLRLRPRRRSCMPIDARYHEQVRLLVSLLPFFNEEP